MILLTNEVLCVKRFCSLFLMVIFLCSFVTSVSAAEDGFLWGDVDGNGVLDRADAEYLALVANGSRALTDGILARGDMNHDSKITPTDVTLLNNYLDSLDAGDSSGGYIPHTPAPTQAPLTEAPSDVEPDADNDMNENNSTDDSDDTAGDTNIIDEPVVDNVNEDKIKDEVPTEEPTEAKPVFYFVPSAFSDKGRAEVKIPASANYGQFYTTGFAAYLNVNYAQKEFVHDNKNIFDTGFVYDQTATVGFSFMNSSMNEKMAKALVSYKYDDGKAFIESTDTISHSSAGEVKVLRCAGDKASVYVVNLDNDSVLYVLILTKTSLADKAFSSFEFSVMEPIEVPTEVATENIEATKNTVPTEQSFDFHPERRVGTGIIVLIVILLLLGIAGLTFYFVRYRKLDASTAKERISGFKNKFKKKK